MGLQPSKMIRPPGALQFKTIEPPNMLEAEFRNVTPKTPNEWFSQRYPSLVSIYGPPLLETTALDQDGKQTCTPVALNELWFAALLGGDHRLGHKVVFLSPEKQFYFKDPMTETFHPTTPQKVANLLDAMFVRCCQEMPNRTDIYNLFVQFRSDAQLKRIVQKAESLLAADQTFFSPSSIYKREHGPEVYAYFAKQFIREAVEPAPEQTLTVSQCFQLFQEFCRDKGIEAMQRRQFRSVIRDVIREELGLGLRNDLPDSRNKEQSGWKGLRIRRGDLGFDYSDRSISNSSDDQAVIVTA